MPGVRFCYPLVVDAWYTDGQTVVIVGCVAGSGYGAASGYIAYKPKDLEVYKTIPLEIYMPKRGGAAAEATAPPLLGYMGLV